MQRLMVRKITACVWYPALHGRRQGHRAPVETGDCRGKLCFILSTGMPISLHACSMRCHAECRLRDSLNERSVPASALSDCLTALDEELELLLASVGHERDAL